MGLLEDLKAAQTAKARQWCPVGQTLANLSEKERVEFQGFLDSKMPGNLISSVMKDNGVHCGKQAVTNHRNQRCSC